MSAPARAQDAFLLLLSGLFVLVATELVLAQGHTLAANGRWVVTKMDLERAVPGATAAFLTRPALARHRLNLGVWHAFQEVVQVEPWDPDRVGYSVSLSDEEYVAMTLRAGVRAQPEAPLVGLRVSRHPDFPSMCLRGDASGRFAERAPLPPRELAAGWHRLDVERTRDGLAVSIDGAPWGRCSMALPGPVHMGFRTGRGKRAAVDDIVLSRHGEVLSQEGFRPAGWRRVAVGVGAGTGLSIALLALASTWLGGASGRETRLRLLTAVGTVLAIATLVCAVDHFVLSRRHPERVDFRHFESRIATEQDVLDRIDARSREPLAPDARRILFLGSSQTWGAGARLDADRWTARVAAALRRSGPDHGSELDLDVIEAGVPGSHSGRLVELFLERWIGLDPEVVVVLLANNDHDPAVLTANLSRLVEASRRAGIRVLFLLEPNTIEGAKSLAKLRRRHDAMRALGEELAVPVIDLQAWLSARHDQGFLWWDRVHLTSFGQELFAEGVLQHRDLLLGGRFSAARRQAPEPGR